MTFRIRGLDARTILASFRSVGCRDSQRRAPCGKLPMGLPLAVSVLPMRRQAMRSSW